MLLNQGKSICSSIILLSISTTAYSHGLIESPASREYFCGQITKPHHVEGKELPYEECRPILTKNGKYNNDVYQFMSVLSHSKGYYQSTTLPKNVCGFDSETFKGGESPWDAAINWPVNTLTAGPKEFVWDITYGPHFSDTEHFRYWITKPDYKFEVGKPLKWSDLEVKPFCEIGWDDKNPNKNPGLITADKNNSKFRMTCNLPQRQGRHIIYAEWGRTQSTSERFHSCIDVQYGAQNNNAVTAKISPIANEFYGEGNIDLNGTQSLGKNLKYQWTVHSNTPDLYTINNATQSIATLVLKNPTAQSDITVTLTVTSGQTSSHSDVKISHMPLVSTQWNEIGKLTNEAKTLNVGDKVVVRAVQKDGEDIYYPQQPLVITSQTVAANAWPDALAKAVNVNHDGLQIGFISAGATLPTPLKHSTNNRIYIKTNSGIQSAYLEIQRGGGQCQVTIKDGRSPWWAGLEVATELAQN
jgi:chitin-binding protein